MLLKSYHKLLGTKCQAEGSIQVDTSCLRDYQPVEGFRAYAAAIAELALAVGAFVADLGVNVWLRVMLRTLQPSKTALPEVFAPRNPWAAGVGVLKCHLFFPSVAVA